MTARRTEGIAGDLVADDDEAQVAIDGVLGELLASHGEGFHEARDVLLRADIAGVKQEGISDLVTLQDFAGASGSGGTGEIGIGRVVCEANAVRGDAQGIMYVAPGGFRDGHDAFGAQQSAAQQEAAGLHAQAGAAPNSRLAISWTVTTYGSIMNKRHLIQGKVDHAGREAVEEQRESHVIQRI